MERAGGEELDRTAVGLAVHPLRQEPDAVSLVVGHEQAARVVGRERAAGWG